MPGPSFRTHFISKYSVISHDKGTKEFFKGHGCGLRGSQFPYSKQPNFDFLQRNQQ